MASIPILHLQASLRPPSLHGERAHVGPSVHHRTLACSPRAHLDLGRAAAPCSDDEAVPSELESQVQSHGRDVSHQKEGSWNVGEWSRAGLVALAAAALCYTDPALAYKGGGPYGIQVTRGQDLSGQDFSGKTLIKQDFKTSILRQANFKGAKLLGASFFDADLTGADLSDADLRGADFSLAQVQKANLSNAILEGALVTGNTSFKNSNITGADFTDVYWREDQKAYLCKVADGVNPVTGNATRDTLFCD